VEVASPLLSEEAVGLAAENGAMLGLDVLYIKDLGAQDTISIKILGVPSCWKSIC
jgi:hypothetical protein